MKMLRSRFSLRFYAKSATTKVQNEPVLEYKHDSKERKELKDELKKLACGGERTEIPVIIGKEPIFSGDQQFQKAPHAHKTIISTFFYANKQIVQKAIDNAMRNREKWRRVSLDERIRIWSNAADLMAGKYRQRLNAATMMGQAKTVIQAEIDTCELIDFMRFNASYLRKCASYKPHSPQPEVSLNTYHLRPLDGFVAAISPFNFTAIGGNLAYTPALAGNTVLWKPSNTAMLSNWIVFDIMREAGLPPGVVNFVPCNGELFGSSVCNSPSLGGINFTGSVRTFRKIWQQLGVHIKDVNCFPRLIGECGGKNYHFVHPTADVRSVVNFTIHSAFEYSGQKCSACSRLYVPRSLWPAMEASLLDVVSKLKFGDICDFSVFSSAVIDDDSYDRIVGCLDFARKSDDCQIIAGGKACEDVGYFVEPTIILTTNPLNKLMVHEIFGPVLTVYVYDDDKLDCTLDLVANSTQFALTGSIFADDKEFIAKAVDVLRMSAGNFYINDKCTGSIVGQQPFGGSRLSGTNDKAGSPHYLARWISPQVIKETFVPMCEVGYPYMK